LPEPAAKIGLEVVGDAAPGFQQLLITMASDTSGLPFASAATEPFPEGGSDLLFGEWGT
jgi:hypothetical protein